LAFDGEAYQARFDALAAAGQDVHGEADLVWSLLGGGGSVLDAGCGTGRVAAELARRGAAVVGVDVDRSMLTEAARRHPELEWVEADLAGLSLGLAFDVVVLAGNVPLFCPPDRRGDLVSSVAHHVNSGGWLVAGFSLGSGYDLADWDAGCAAAGLVPEARWSTWDRRPWSPGSDYAVSVHQRPA
jgi:SAM-dependent methyltransferase